MEYIFSIVMSAMSGKSRSVMVVVSLSKSLIPYIASLHPRVGYLCGLGVVIDFYNS